MRAIVTLKKVGSHHYRAAVDLNVDSLSGYSDYRLGASGPGVTAGESIENAASKALAMIQANPAISTVLSPVAGPQLTSILIAARSLDRPNISHKFDKPTRRLINAYAHSLKRGARKASVSAPNESHVKIGTAKLKAVASQSDKETIKALNKEGKKLASDISDKLIAQGVDPQDAIKQGKKKAKQYLSTIEDQALDEGAASVGSYFGGPVGGALAKEVMDKFGKKLIHAAQKKLAKAGKKVGNKIGHKLHLW